MDILAETCPELWPPGLKVTNIESDLPVHPLKGYNRIQPLISIRIRICIRIRIRIADGAP